MISRSYQRFAAVSAVLAGIGALGYAVAFIVLRNAGLSAGLLLLNGLVTAAALIGVYAALRPVDDGLATLGLVLGLAGALGSAVHGGCDLAVVLHPLAGSVVDAPNAVDPRGLLTFGVTGLGLLVLGRLIVRGGPFPRALGYVAVTAGTLLVLLYLARLIVLNPADPLVLVPALLTGFLIDPLLYLGLGIALHRSTARSESAPVAGPRAGEAVDLR
jgi:hypothetical protein